jgi:hypothetical protein
LLTVGVAGDNASEQMPRLQDEVHGESGPERAEGWIVQHGVAVVNRPNRNVINVTHVPFLEPLAGRLIFFTLRGRRNWLQIAGDGGLKSAAVLPGLAATTKHQGLNPWEYLKHLLTASAARPPGADCSDLLSEA